MSYNEKEKNEAKKNGFIFVGKTGSGKSTLINVLLGEEKCKVERKAKAVTTKTDFYYYKLKNGRMITVLDTPGLSDPKTLNDPNIDKKYLEGIREVIAKELIQIKGIIFLVNFQTERFDASEQQALLNYNTIFPLKEFWKHVLVIFTHYYQDPDGDNVEEMKKQKDSSNKEILIEIMEKVKNVSDVISYNELQTKYFNSYCPVKNEKQKLKNNKNKEELEVILNYFYEKPPLFSKIEITYNPLIRFFNSDGKIIKESGLYIREKYVNEKLEEKEKNNKDDDCMIF